MFGKLKEKWNNLSDEDKKKWKKRALIASGVGLSLGTLAVGRSVLKGKRKMKSKGGAGIISDSIPSSKTATSTNSVSASIPMDRVSSIVFNPSDKKESADKRTHKQIQLDNTYTRLQRELDIINAKQAIKDRKHEISMINKRNNLNNLMSRY